MSTQSNSNGGLKAPEFLSPSSISTFNQCPLKFKYSKIDNIKDPSGKEALLGNFVHDILEEMYKLPPEFRTQEQAKIIAKEQWDTKWAVQVQEIVTDDKNLKLFRWSAWWCVENLWRLEDPALIAPHSLESFVSGGIGGVKIRGFIDRLTRDAVTGAPKISDYKTGKTPRKSDLQDRFFQLIIYSQLLSSIGIESEESSAELLYLKDGVRFEMQITPSDVSRVVEKIQNTKSGIDERCVSGEFEAKKSVLCGWCGYKSFCPAWK